MRTFIRDRLNPVLLRTAGFGLAPRTRWLSGQRSLLLKDLGIDTVLDVGANVGQYGRALRAAGFAGRIHSFEPASAPRAALERLAAADDRWHVHGLALSSAPGIADLQTWAGTSSEAGSLRKPVAGMIAMHGQPTVEKVETDSLQNWLGRQPAVVPEKTLLKIDVQGSERDVLEGAGEALPRFAVLEVEAAMSRLYEGEASLADLLISLNDASFVPVSVMTERFHTGWRGAADVDVLAIRADLSRLPT